MSLTSYRAAPPRVNLRGKPKLTGLEEPPNERAAFAARGPVGGPRCMSPKSVERFWDNDMHQHNRNEKIPLTSNLDREFNVRLADLAATYSPAS